MRERQRADLAHELARKRPYKDRISKFVFLLDLDNTLLDNDKAQQDYFEEIRRKVNLKAAVRYLEIFEQIRIESGYADYLGALQRYRIEDLHDPGLFRVSSYLLDYPFEERLLPHVNDAIRYLGRFGPVVILTDGDIVFQPRKIERSGLWDAVGGRVLVCVHKERELYDVERRFPAEHYVVVDDKLSILTSIKSQWKQRVTTVFVRQGHYAYRRILEANPPADLSINVVGDILKIEEEKLLSS